MGMPSMPELIIILLIIVLLFGAKKIPELAKGVGSGIKNFKKAIKDDDSETDVVQAESKKIKSEDEVATNKPDETTKQA